MIRQILAGAVGLVGMLGAAQAASPLPLFNWSGAYGGISGGIIDRDSLFFFPLGGFDVSHGGSTGIVGGHLGWQQQFGSWVLGIEGNGSSSFRWLSRDCPNPAFSCQTRLTNIMTVGPRLGYASNNWLFFVTGGYAEGSISSRAIDQTGRVIEQTRYRHHGYFIGAGVEYAWSRNFSFGIEYQRIDLDTQLHCPFGFCGASSRNIDATSDIVRARLTWHFGAPFGPAR